MAKQQIQTGIQETKDLKLNVQERQDVSNLADDKLIVDPVTTLIDEIIKSHEQKMQVFWDEMLHYDYMFRCGLNSAQKSLNKPMASPEDAKSDVGATMFFRQIMQSAAKYYSLQTGRDALWKYSTVYTKGVELSKEDGQLQADMMNTLVDWSLRKEEFDPKLMTMDLMIAKYGILFVGVNWLRKTGKKKVRIPSVPTLLDKAKAAITKTSTKKSEFIEVDTIYENRPETIIINPYSIRLDPNIDTIQKQDCVGVTATIPFSNAIEMVENGYWSEDRFAEIKPNHGWDGTAGIYKKGEQDANSIKNVSTSSSDKTSMFLMWDCFANLPIDEKGKLDQKKSLPFLHRCTFLGNTIADSICVRIERSDDPDGEIPIHAVHDYPDDPDRMFHISKGAVLKNNFAVEVTAVNQMIDGVSLALNPPIMEKKGAVISSNRQYGRGKRIVVRDNVQTDMKEFTVNDRTQTGLALLTYIKDDSKMAIHTDPAQMGEGLGSRASATESSGVMRLSAAPSVMNAKYVTSQLFGYLARKYKSLWQEFALDDQVIQITDTDAAIQTVKPAEVYGEFDIKVDVVDQMVNDIMEEQKAAQDIAAFGANQIVSQLVDWESMMEEYFIRRYGRSFVKDSTDADAVTVARQENRQIMSGVSVKPEEGQNHKIHIRQHKIERLRYRGAEEEFALQIKLLDAMIEGHEQMMESSQGEGRKTQATETEGQQVPPEGQEAMNKTPAVAAQPAVAGGGAANMPAAVGGPR